jgi:hypothetical protein
MRARLNPSLWRVEVVRNAEELAAVAESLVQPALVPVS